jgi:starch synthase (maltosyl-transferring)
MPDYPSIIIEAVMPDLDRGKFPSKCAVGEQFVVEADIFNEARDVLGAKILYRQKNLETWLETPMRPGDNDRWRGEFVPLENTDYLYTVEAWVNPLATILINMEKKFAAAEQITHERAEAQDLLKQMARQAKGQDKEQILCYQKLFESIKETREEIIDIIESAELGRLVTAYPLKRHQVLYGRTLELRVDRKAASYAAWYEMFPRSQGKIAGQSGTFKDCSQRLDDIKSMGFNVIYLPPIHPIGQTNRKGPNNSLTADNSSPGSPWAIGSEAGGHKAVHPELGTVKDFEDFVKEASKRDIEIALDLAFQCSPDHPYVKEHPDWFYHRPDGSIQYAENPPKKYQDIYPLNFHTPDKEALWAELKSVVEFWVERGVKTFRVDNPHTKPLLFWHWLIEEIHKHHPEVIFLSEAFTRPKVMKFLAKVGFTQSYTYFTWKNTKWELRSYFEELMQPEVRAYFRGNLFPATPDILHEYLQRGGAPAFKVRLVLAATLSSVYGIYSGYELCENRAKPGTEEYLDSEKYQYKVWDWDRPGNIKPFIARINAIRRENIALHEYGNLEFYQTSNDSILSYGKRSADGKNVIIVVVNLDPVYAHEDMLFLPLKQLGIDAGRLFQVEDLLNGEVYTWRGPSNYVRLDPWRYPAHILRLIN